jgi:alkylhydroperoxidase/carboxymuconolactone decarboxylase family protein YurZ
MTELPSESGTETPVMDVLVAMTAASLERTSLDPQTLMLVRLAALVGVDAPPLSYDLNLKAAGQLGVTTEQVEGVLAAIAPVVGAPRVVAAAGNILRAVGIEIAVAEAELAAKAEGGAGATEDAPVRVRPA